MLSCRKNYSNVYALFYLFYGAPMQVSNAYLQLRGSGTKMQFEFIKDMPRVAQQELPIDISFLVGKLVFVWMIMLLFPVWSPLP